MSQFLAMAAKQGNKRAAEILEAYIRENPNIYKESRAWQKVEEEEEDARYRKVRAEIRKARAKARSPRDSKKRKR